MVTVATHAICQPIVLWERWLIIQRLKLTECNVTGSWWVGTRFPHAVIYCRTLYMEINFESEVLNLFIEAPCGPDTWVVRICLIHFQTKSSCKPACRFLFVLCYGIFCFIGTCLLFMFGLESKNVSEMTHFLCRLACKNLNTVFTL